MNNPGGPPESTHAIGNKQARKTPTLPSFSTNAPWTARKKESYDRPGNKLPTYTCPQSNHDVFLGTRPYNVYMIAGQLY